METAKLLTRSDADASCIYIVRPSEARCQVVIKMTMKDLNADLLAHLTELLRKLSGDISLQIIDIDEGSVRLTLSLSSVAAERLMAQWTEKHLIELCGFEVTAVVELPAEANDSKVLSMAALLEEAHAHFSGAARTVEFDERVRSLLAAGEINTATALVLRVLGPEILSFLSGVLGKSDADEVFSALCERLWRSLGGFEGRCSIRTWVYVLARSEIGRFQRGTRRAAKSRVPISELQDILAAVTGESDATAATSEQAQLAALREDLPVEDRALLILRVDRKLAFDEIALAFAETPETFRDDDRKREGARLRKRFQIIKQRLADRARARDAGPTLKRQNPFRAHADPGSADSDQLDVDRRRNPRHTTSGHSLDESVPRRVLTGHVPAHHQTPEPATPSSNLARGEPRRLRVEGFAICARTEVLLKQPRSGFYVNCMVDYYARAGTMPAPTGAVK